jgi:hypothetical protein
MRRLARWLAALCRPLPPCDCPRCRAARAEALVEVIRAGTRRRP